MHAVAPDILRRHRQQWLALSACLAALLLALGGWLLAQRQTLLDNEGERLLGQVHVVERNLARQLWATNQTLVQLIGELPRWREQGQLDRANAWLRAMAEIHVGVRTVSVLDADGRVLASSREALIGRTFADRDYFQAVRRSNDPGLFHLSAPFRNALGVYAVNVTRAVQDTSGAFAGVVTATLDPDYFSQQLDTVNFAPDVRSAVVHDSGAVVMVSPALPRSEAVPLRWQDAGFAQRLADAGGQALQMGRLPLRGERGLLAQQTVRVADTKTDHALVVAISRDASAVLAGWQRLAWSAAVLSGLLVLVTAGGLRWIQRAERAAATRLAETLDRLDRIGQTAPGVICQFVLHADGHASMPFSTRPLEPYFGLPVSDVPGTADVMFKYMDPEHVEAMRGDILASARTLQPYRHEFKMLVPGQPERWLDVHSVPQRRDDGSTIWTGVVMDSTEHRAARESLVALDAAQRASRAKSEFLSRASHELRTPLNAVIGFASLLLSHPREVLTASQRQQLGYIHDAGQHLLALINDLLDVSSIESGRVRAVIDDVPVAPLLAEALSTVREAAAAAGVQLSVRLDAPRLAARADRVRLKQVLLNLLSNAVKYNHPGGAVTLVLAGSPAEGVQIEVHDTGAGLSAEQRGHLFEPFNRLGADRRGIAGTGIGLTIVKMLVELMQGRITVDSTPGRGSRFVVHLPASPEPAAAPPAPAAPALLPLPPAAPAALSVLYVEDNTLNAQLVQTLLALRPAVHLVVATSGAEALQAVQREVPHLVLVDLHLGDMSGFELMARLRTDPALADLRYAALTADAMPATQLRAHQAGFFDFLTKPVDVQRLLQLIDGEVQARAV